VPRGRKAALAAALNAAVDLDAAIATAEGTAWTVREREHETRRLVTLTGTSPYWGEEWSPEALQEDQVEQGELLDFGDALVTIKPPAEASDELVHAVCERVQRAGGSVVHVAPRPPKQALVPAQAAGQAAAPEQTMRGAVTALLAASTSAHKPELELLLETVMGEEKL
jgi:hypothetical protein